MISWDRDNDIPFVEFCNGLIADSWEIKVIIPTQQKEAGPSWFAMSNASLLVTKPMRRGFK